MPFGRRLTDRVPVDRRETLRLEPARETRRVWSPAATGLFVLACLYTLRTAQEFLIPLVVGVLVYFLLIPVVRLLKRLGIAEAIGSAIVCVSLVAVVALGLYALSYPAASWVARAPESIRGVEAKLRPIVRRMEKVTETAEQIEKVTAGATPAGTPEVQVKEPGIKSAFLWGMQSFLGGVVIVLTLVYFLLASGETVLDKVIRSLPRLADRERAVDIAREMERQISSYLLWTTIINAGLGVVVAAALWAMGMPNPLLWGAVAAVTNFIPYLGGVVATVVIGLAALLAFDDPWKALLVPAMFFLINTLESYVITPKVMGRQFTLDPAVLFVGLLFWWFVWGTAGALLAVPMMAAFKIFCERVESLQKLAAFLGDEDAPAEPVAVPSAAAGER